jgi:hypothetical protein
MMTFDEAKTILAALEGVRYVLVGSMGMAAQGLVRATRDIDLFVSPDPENVDRLKEALKSIFDDPRIDEISADDLGGAYPVIEYVPPHGRYSMDILARLGDTFRYEDIESEEMMLDGIRVRVATPRTLWRRKRDTVRPQDRVDAEAIRREFDLGEK